MNSKRLEPLAPEIEDRLREIQQLDVTKFSEADVRAEVIDPIVRALGYKKQTSFSSIREKHLKVLEGDLFPDYSLLVLEEHFWIIEAKKVLRAEVCFTANELKQAVSYAVHPAINAALVALCDGRIFQVFDREDSLVEPVLTVEIPHLLRDFDKLRRLLGPWQAWFFQKRRVLRLIDKVFDREITMARLDEFRRLVDQRLDSKRSLALENHRRIASSLKEDEQLQLLRESEPRDLIDIHFFGRHSTKQLEAMSTALVSACKPSSFKVLHAIFPDHPRYATERYWGAALHFLLSLESVQPEVSWLPAYLAEPGKPKTKTAAAATRLIRLCLTGFASLEGERLVLLHSFSARRLAKQMMVVLPPMAELGQQLHALVRHQIDERSFTQQVSSPHGNLLRLLDDLQVMASQKFVTDHRSPSGYLETDRARQSLKDAWHQERLMLGDGKTYREVRRARRLDDEIAQTEALSVVYDQMGHSALCVLEQFPRWKTYVIANHRHDLERLARFGSWQAKEWFGLAPDGSYPRSSLKEAADQFFFGDMDTCVSLAIGYGYALPQAPEART